jgi:hypothetical protein
VHFPLLERAILAEPAEMSSKGTPFVSASSAGLAYGEPASEYEDHRESVSHDGEPERACDPGDGDEEAARQDSTERAAKEVRAVE